MLFPIFEGKMAHRFHLDNIHKLVNSNLDREGGGYFYPLSVLLGNSCITFGILEHSVTFHQKHLHQIRYLILALIFKYWKKPQTGEIPISGFLFKSLINKNYDNSRNRCDIDMKLGPITKLDKTTSKKLKMTSCRLFWRHYNISDLWPFWSNPEAAFRIYVP